MLNVAILAAAGYDSAQSPERVQITTGSGLEYAARLKVDVLNELGIDRRDFPMLAHTLPPSATVAGVLGLDFFRDLKLLIDFRSGQLTID